MAEALLHFPVGLFAKAISLAAEEISSMWHAEKDLQSLAEKLEMIEALLTDAASKKASSGAVVHWLKRLQRVAHEVDNLLDKFAYELLRQKVETQMQDKVRSYFSLSNPFIFRVKMAHKIKKINLAVEAVYRESNEIGLRPVNMISNSTNLTSERVTDPFVDESEIVGRTDEVGKIVSMLTSSRTESDLAVIGIWGMPGQGKSTVARLIYKNEKVVNHFQKRIWLSVSNDFEIERLLNNMVQCLTGTISELTIREVIVRKLNSEMKSKRFLLVLDDVWNEDADLWDCMRKCLQGIGGSQGSRILVTTRNEKVMSIMQTSSIHHLGRLSNADSNFLLEKIAFLKDGARKTPQLVHMCKRIAEKCGGVPLAIKAIGGLMNSNIDECEWSKIEANEMWISLDTVGKVSSAIKLSYDYLPSLFLKQCFAYCSLIEKDCVMRKELLIQLWMAQGLLHPSKESALDVEDVGSNYFNVLLQRSLFQDPIVSDYGDIVSCKMHDLVHDFASLASGDCHLIMTDDLLNVDIKVLHLEIHATGIQELNISKESFSKLRTLAIDVAVPNNVLEDALANSKHIRVLYLADKRIKELPRSIAKLKHLRYLDISRTSIRTLSSSIRRLYQLQTLKLDYLQKLPGNLQTMVSLRNLDIWGEQDENRKSCLLPGIGQLSTLRTLNFYVVCDDRGCKIDELGPLNNLKGRLEIFGLQNVRNKEEAAKANLSRKKNLDDIVLEWDGNARDDCNDLEVLDGLKPPSSLKGLTIVNFRGRNLPSWMLTTNQQLSLRSVVNITLENFSICEQIPCLGHLPNLKMLKISEMDGVKYIGSEFYGWKNPNPASSGQSGRSLVILEVFPALKILIIKGMSSLEKWLGVDCHGESHSSVTVFRSLEVLKVENCPNLNSLPNGIWRNIVSLRRLFIKDCVRLCHLPEDLVGLTSLQKLKVVSCPNVVSFPTIHSQKSLYHLEIRKCLKLGALPRGLEFCTSLKILAVIGCPALCPEGLNRLSVSTIHLKELYLGHFPADIEYFPLLNYSPPATNCKDEIQHPLSVSLEVLALYGWPKLKSLPEEIRQFSALQFLDIIHFDGIEGLPEWLCNLNSLRGLYLGGCDSLMSLPSTEALGHLNNLRRLQIHGCPLLEERCKKDIGPEWHKIAHIPTILINDERIQDISLNNS